MDIISKILNTKITPNNLNDFADMIMDDEFEKAPLQVQVPILKLMVSVLLTMCQQYEHYIENHMENNI